MSRSCTRKSTAHASRQQSTSKNHTQRQSAILTSNEATSSFCATRKSKNRSIERCACTTLALSSSFHAITEVPISSQNSMAQFYIDLLPHFELFHISHANPSLFRK